MKSRIALREANGVDMVADRSGELNRWCEHFELVTNVSYHVDADTVKEIPSILMSEMGDISRTRMSLFVNHQKEK